MTESLLPVFGEGFFFSFVPLGAKTKLEELLFVEAVEPEIPAALKEHGVKAPEPLTNTNKQGFQFKLPAFGEGQKVEKLALHMAGNWTTKFKVLMEGSSFAGKSNEASAASGTGAKWAVTEKWGSAWPWEPYTTAELEEKGKSEEMFSLILTTGKASPEEVFKIYLTVTIGGETILVPAMSMIV